MTSTDRWIAAGTFIFACCVVIFSGWMTIKIHDTLHEHFPPQATGE